MTVNDLSKRLGVPPRRVRELMREDAARGLVVIDRFGRWRLTAVAERAFGHTLRGLTELNTPAAVRGLRHGGPYSADSPQGSLGSLDDRRLPDAVARPSRLERGQASQAR